MHILQLIQEILGEFPDGIWGPLSQDALWKEVEETYERNDKIERIQALLNVKVDGVWGPKSQAALNLLKGEEGWRETKFTSFADPDDVKNFLRCKSTGKSDVYCFGFGDNGIGQFGELTAQEHTPMVAIHGDEMVRKWGSRFGAAHRPVEIEYKGIVVRATCEDRISATGKVDLNPAAFKALGLEAPFVVHGRWRWL